MQMPSEHAPVRSALTRRSLLTGGGAAAAAVALAACSGGSGGSGGGSASGKPLVIVGCYGVQYMAQQVCGDRAEVVSTARPGQEPHDVELSLADTAKIQKADVIIQIPGFQPALDDVISSKGLSSKVLDVSKTVTLIPASQSESGTVELGGSDGGGEHDHEHDHGHDHEHGEFDPHFWNDPVLLGTVATELGKRLGAAKPDQKSAFADAAKKTADALGALAEEMTKKFEAVKEPRVFVTGHTAFAYLAKRFHLEQVGIAGVDPENEPSPQRLLALQKLIRDKKVSTVFFEESASPKVAETLAKNVGVKSDSLDNCETQLDPKKDYPAVMRENTTKLLASWR